MSDFIAVTAIRHQDTDSQTQKKWEHIRKKKEKQKICIYCLYVNSNANKNNSVKK